jgi:hypothetical protein
MTALTAVQCDAVWLKPLNYEVTALNSKLAARVPELERALMAGLPAYPDGSRQAFYDIELDNGWAYIHVHDDSRTVYLVAYSRN